MPGSGNPCIYCERPANSEEHILATWLMSELENCTGRAVPHGQAEYGSGLIVPLSVTTTSKGKRQFNFTSDTICRDCNGVWMNQVDERARPYLRKLICGQSVPITGKMRKAVASWAVKTAITTRFAHINPNPVEGAWAKQLMTDNRHLPAPLWFVWLARYVGRQDLWFRGAGIDVAAISDLNGQAGDSPPTFSDGVVATLVIGQLCVQALRINGPAFPLTVAHPGTVAVWPRGPRDEWPPPQHLDDSSLEAFANRFYGSPMTFAVERPARPGEAGQSVFLTRSPITPDELADNERYVITIGYDCECGTHTDLPHDTGGPLRDLRVPYAAEADTQCPNCDKPIKFRFTLSQIPGA